MFSGCCGRMPQKDCLLCVQVFQCFLSVWRREYYSLWYWHQSICKIKSNQLHGKFYLHSTLKSLMNFNQKNKIKPYQLNHYAMKCKKIALFKSNSSGHLETWVINAVFSSIWAWIGRRLGRFRKIAQNIGLTITSENWHPFRGKSSVVHEIERIWTPIGAPVPCARPLRPP